MAVSNNPFTIGGRMHRVSYICTIIFLWIIGMILNAFLCYVYDHWTMHQYTSFDVAAGIIIILIDIWMLEIFFAVTVKRLRDIHASGWWCLLNFIPVVNFIIFIVLAIIPPKHHDDDGGLDQSVFNSQQQVNVPPVVQPGTQPGLQPSVPPGVPQTPIPPTQNSGNPQA